MNQAKLSANFNLSEFLYSDLAARSGRVIEADPFIVENLRRLCTEVMEPIRTHLGGKVIVITSGYRPDWLNKLAGGSRVSEHKDGRACDFKVQGYTPLQVCQLIQPILDRLPINQLILEFGQWTHVSIAASEAAPLQRALTASVSNGVTSYMSGIHAPSERAS